MAYAANEDTGIPAFEVDQVRSFSVIYEEDEVAVSLIDAYGEAIPLVFEMEAAKKLLALLAAGITSMEQLDTLSEREWEIA